MRTVLLAAFAAFGLGSAAQAASQFDLACKGTESITSTAWQGIGRGIAKPVVHDVSLRYRVDLDKNVYCAGDCAELHTIFAVSPTTITLVRTVLVYSNIDVSFQIDRNTGAFDAEGNGPREIDQSTGKCELEPFSGMPTTKF